MENTIKLEDASTPAPTPEVPLVNIKVDDDNVALNLLVAFVGVAQKRGSFNVQEASKIWECISRFTNQTPNATPK